MAGSPQRTLAIDCDDHFSAPRFRRVENRLTWHPTDRELEILQVLWESGPSSLGQICTALQRKRPVVTTTVATVLKVMLGKKLVKRTEGARGYLWSAKLARRVAATGMIQNLVDRVFDGSAERLVAHLLESGELTDDDRKELRRLLGSHRK